MTENPASSVARVRIWDVPTRLVHWLIVASVATSWWTAERGDLELHRYSGYLLLGLLLFRIYWGFAGSSSARFAHFVKGPRAIARYLRSGSTPSVGHNPLGALSVVALLLLLLIQVTLGLFAVDVDGLESGPLSHYVSFEVGRACAKWHETVFDVLVWIIVLHIAAVLFYVIFRKQNLIGAMLHGHREYAEQPGSSIRFASVTRTIVGIVLAVALTWMIARGLELP
ncbi:MAG: Ni/Fe-hydrogenase 1 b-type cytochrome subunit [Xanthomonadaceae bacterium]|nr:Ni/Fe-hydrogenase 1 b-type cytochrome subunit [Xanthomonadaceae bacterium]